MPWKPKVQFAPEMKWDKLEIRIYSGADGEFTLYEIDNYNWDDTHKLLTISDIIGEFFEMIKNRTFRILLVKERSGTGMDETLNPDKLFRNEKNPYRIELKIQCQ